MNKKFTIIFFVATLVFLFSAISVSAMAVPGSYVNTAKRADWTKYGLNPWSWDTDQDGYDDAQEIKNNYCPTNSDYSAVLKSSDCSKGQFNLSKKIYTPPLALSARLPQDLKKFTSCAALSTVAQKRFEALYSSDDTKYNAKLFLGLTSSTDYYSGSFVQIYEADLAGAKADVKTPAGAAYGDIVKTDGQYVYSFGYQNFGIDDESFAVSNLSVVKLGAGGAAKSVAQMALPAGPTYYKIFLSGRYLAVLGTTNLGADSANKFARGNTYVAIYDLKNPAKPRFLRNFVLSGDFKAAVLGKDGWLYVASARDQYDLALRNSGQSTYRLATSTKSAPLVFESNRAFDSKNLSIGKPAVACGSIGYFEKDQSFNYLTISALKMNGGAGVQSTVLFGSVEFGYLTPGNLYLAVSRKIYGNTGLSNTSFYRWNLGRGVARLDASQVVPGDVSDKNFAISADGRHLLVLSGGYNRSTRAEENNFYALDGWNLGRLGWLNNFYWDGSLGNLAVAGKRVYATDNSDGKLAVLDIADIKKPRFAGAGKLPYDLYGLSGKLFSLPNNQFLSFGNVKDDSVTSTSVLSSGRLRFDWSDASDPGFLQNIGRRDLGEGTSYLPGMFEDNYLAWDGKNNLAAFSLILTAPKSDLATTTKIDFNGLMVYRLNTNEKKLEFVGNVARASNDDDNLVTMGINTIRRAFFVGDYLYALSLSNLTVHKISDLSITASVPISNTTELIKAVDIIRNAFATAFASLASSTTSSLIAN